jgi:pSer/pThr/pTyr-binding forkhead associated (FHA) protein
MKLELTSVDHPRPPIILHQFPVIVGYNLGEEICLNDSSVGHYQCMIDDSDGALMVWDLGTKLGTSINGVRISQKASLLPGDELGIGKNRFVVHYNDGAAKLSRRGEQDERSDFRSPAPSHRRRQAVAPL